jgi:hypothetical protein
MKRRVAGFLLTLAATSGCANTQGNFGGGQMGMAHDGGPVRLASSEHGGPVGPHGVPMVAGGGMGMMGGGMGAGAMMAGGMGNPASVMQAGYVTNGDSALQLTSGCSGGGCGLPGAPPMGMMGGMGGVNMDPGAYAQYGRVHAFGQLPLGPDAAMQAQRTQVRFVGPTGAKVGWYIAGPNGPVLSPTQLDVPGRYNFAQAAVYRLKLSNIPGRPGVEIFPSVEVVPGNAKTDAFLSHNVVPVEFTDEDFDQINTGHYLTKVIYLPDAQYMSMTGGAEELSSTRLEPGIDPLCEAQRRGSVLLVVRVGSINMELPNSPPLASPGPYGAPGGPPPGGPGMMPGGPMMAPQGGPVSPVGYSVPGQGGMPMYPGMGEPPVRPSFPQTRLPAPKSLSFDLDDITDAKPVRVREGLFDKAVWK